VRFKNISASIELEGTLTIPNSTLKSEHPAKAVILITGSGPQNRDEELLGHQPFWVLADYLSRNGIIVLRFDDRGVGKSGGKFKGATSEDFATDVASAVAYLKNRSEVDTHKIGLIGHSEGGFIAPMVASENPDVAYIVLLAGTGVTGAEILAKQNELMSRQGGMSEDLIGKIDKINRSVYALILDNGRSTKAVKELLAKKYNLLGQSDSKKYIALEYQQLSSPWFQFFLKTDPKQFLSQVKIPVLALNGTNDLQVDAEQNLSAIESILKSSGNTRFIVKRLTNLNHLFQTSKTGAVSEYALNEETFSPIALKLIVDWLNTQ